jgi:hypothetical protein
MSTLVSIITSKDGTERDQSLDAFCRSASLDTLLQECEALHDFRRSSTNLYHRVRALFFLYAIHRFHMPLKKGLPHFGYIPHRAFDHLLKRRFEEAIEGFSQAQREQGPSDSLSSAIAEACRQMALQTLADQVRQSVRSVKGNQWMFRIGHPADQPLRVVPAMYRQTSPGEPFPILCEATPVRMDLSHSGWSDIFFLGMDFPEGARVLNTSIDLCVRDDRNDDRPAPPVESYLRVIDRPVLRLVSIDLGTVVELKTIAQVFEFAADYVGLLRAGIIASGIVPPGMEGTDVPLADLFARMIAPGCGLELVTHVKGIPKGSRLAVSTTLLASIITVCMRATEQITSLVGTLTEEQRDIVAARAILGEWLGGSGGGWQDSGGVWPGIKLIQGVTAGEGDPESGISRGRLLPSHHIFGTNEVSTHTREALQDSLVLVHGGMAQDVGPILEMVTEKYLLRSETEWRARMQAMQIFDAIIATLKAGDIRNLGSLTHRNFHEPIQTIIPWAHNPYTEAIVQSVQTAFGKQFWGFWMLGGMSGGGMGFLFDPGARADAAQKLAGIMADQKRKFETGIPFAMDPVVYRFAINEDGTRATMTEGDQAMLPLPYYSLVVPGMIRSDARLLSPQQQEELVRFGTACRTRPGFQSAVTNLVERILPHRDSDLRAASNLKTMLETHGFDRVQHEQVRDDLRNGRIGLSQNRLPSHVQIEDARNEDVTNATQVVSGHFREIGERALANGELAVLSLAAGAGSRWTRGAGTVKALHPFCRLGDHFRTFLEVHLAKTRRSAERWRTAIPHIVATSYLTHDPIAEYLKRTSNCGYDGPVYLSRGSAIGLRLVPMVRDLRFLWEESVQQVLDEQAQKLRESLRATLMGWAQQAGEGSDYTDNLPTQCLHPVGHWFEFPGMMVNGTLASILAASPRIRYIMLHNIDTVGVDLDPALLGMHIDSGAVMTAELTNRRLIDRGGGLARVDGSLRLIEGMALPREDMEFSLRFYNSASYWIDLDGILSVFHLTRDQLNDRNRVVQAVRAAAARMPAYVTIKEVKKRWGRGQEDIYPTSQYERLWGDMTLLPECPTRYVVVPRVRGQQLKEVAQMDGWLRDGSAAYVEQLCGWR